ncbi:MAG TPA: cyclic pyranopterin monophosphate synthase MoaC [Mycobacteriales bacterium]|nr:cyclic pyranopterin monophosphate synthase MoaC [Mycobacteriales bacterium]
MDAALTHLDPAGRAAMVDVSDKQATARFARARAVVRMSPEAAARVQAGDNPKGDVVAVARIAGIMGAKRVPDLVPLCHPIALHGVTVDVTLADDAVVLTAVCRTADRTGVEMEALTAVVVAALAVVDMVKAVDPAAVITDVRVLEKTGGAHGDWHRDDPVATPPS